MAGSEGRPTPPGSRSSVTTLLPVVTAIAFFIVAVVSAGFGKYVMSVVSLISGLAILSYVIEVKHHER